MVSCRLSLGVQGPLEVCIAITSQDARQEHRRKKFEGSLNLLCMLTTRDTLAEVNCARPDFHTIIRPSESQPHRPSLGLAPHD